MNNQATPTDHNIATLREHLFDVLAGLKDKGFKGEDWSGLHLMDILAKLEPRMERIETEDHQMLVLLRAL